MAFETVYTMTDWYDGPRRGIALVNGRPHLYESCWNDIESDEPGVFVLSPVSDSVLFAALEDWAIWQRWWHAHKTGKSNIDTHPALLEDRARHFVLVRLLKADLVIDENRKFAATAQFRFNVDTVPKMEAEWTIVKYADTKDNRNKYSYVANEDDPNETINPSGGSG